HGLPQQTASPQSPSPLDALRRLSPIGEARAGRLPDRNLLITAGTSLPCVLQTAMDSAAPGYVSCLVSRDVYSDNGAVVLMERGTRVLGEYRGGLETGRRRLFVLWTRAVTPTGVAVALASPAADALGRSGFDGEIDPRFWDRFGGALLLSIVDDGVYAAAGRGQDFQSAARVPSDAAAIALQNSVAIPPTLRKAQGSEVSIFVAQDLDFAGVYRLRPR
ncbi:MAG: type IV secretion system protein VirB10, partial [Brevundimonas diminuta]